MAPTPLWYLFGTDVLESDRLRLRLYFGVYGTPDIV